ncbi:MAG: mechanosensitive ion channel family protein [Acidobacteriota bacterium]
MVSQDWTLLNAWSDLLDRLGWDASAWMSRLALAGLVLLLAFVANWLAKRVIVRGLRALARRTTSDWDDALVRHRVFERLSQLAPALVVFAAAPVLFPAESEQIFENLLARLANLWMVLVSASAAGAFIEAVGAILRGSPATRDKPIRSYVQVAKILLWLAASIIAVATLMDKNPWSLLGGLGAMTAILLLVFRDSILGFVASVQIASYDLARVGDWIEVPAYGADGDVLEISLHTIKVQNWDKTIVSVPTVALMSSGFKNWRGMSESGGRRIKRALILDMNSARFLQPNDVERLKAIQILRDYIEQREQEVAAWNSERGIETTSPANGRRLTNLGTFRAYVEGFLQANFPVHPELTFLVRQLAPTADGLPLEIYFFSSEQRWAQYEGIIADIFDHLLAVLPEFDLRVFQRPSGADFRVALGGSDEVR